MQLAPKPSTDNLDLYIQLMEKQNKRQKQRLMKLGALIGLALLFSAGAVIYFVGSPFGGKESKQITYLMFQEDYLPHQEIIGFLNQESHGVIIKDVDDSRADTLLDLGEYEGWLREQNLGVGFSANQYRASYPEPKEESDEPEINTSPLGLVVRGQLVANRPLTFSVSGYRPDFDYELNFGNGRARNVNERYTYRYPESGDFVVRLTAKDDDGNSRSIRRRITIRLPKPKDEVIADNETEEEAPTLVITDLGPQAQEEDAEVAQTNISSIEGEELGFEELEIEEAQPLSPSPESLRDNRKAPDTIEAAPPSSPENSNLIDFSNHVFLATEVAPKFPGGNKGLKKFLGRNLDYPDKAMERKIEGKVVVQFVVNADGSISNPKILQSLGYGCDEEVIKIIAEMPKWEPGLMAGRPVNASYTLPVIFTIR